MDGCEVRLCDPCALVRPRVPCVSRVCPGSPRCLFIGTVCVPAPPGVFLPVRFLWHVKRLYCFVFVFTAVLLTCVCIFTERNVRGRTAAVPLCDGGGVGVGSVFIHVQGRRSFEV